MKNLIYIGCFVLLWACQKQEHSKIENLENLKPEVIDNGITIRLKKENPLFKTIRINKNALKGEFSAPTTVVANILAPTIEGGSKIILFEAKELNELYTAYLQSLAHLKRDSEYLNRVKDMYQNKAATGIELQAAETGVSDAATEVAEKEAEFRIAGFDPKELANAQTGYAWLIANVAENKAGNLQKGQICDISFTSFPAEKWKGRIISIGDVLDIATRTLKVRIELPNSQNKLKPGMYAQTHFSEEALNVLFVPASAVVSVQGKNYVFKKEGLIIKRLEVVTEKQVGENIIIQSGIGEGDEIVTESTILLKGLSFGY